MNKELVIVLDFGGQYNQLIARRVRECSVYCEVHPYTLKLDEIKAMNPKGIIFTGGPNSVYGEEAPRYDKRIFDLGIPIFGICYGSQLMAYTLGGSVESAPVSEYGKAEVTVDQSSLLFDGVSEKTICWMSHTDYISKACRFPGLCDDSGLSGCGDGTAGKESICDPVPSGGDAHTGRLKDVVQFCYPCVRLPRRLEDVFLCGGYDLVDPPESGKR